MDTTCTKNNGQDSNHLNDQAPGEGALQIAPTCIKKNPTTRGKKQQKQKQPTQNTSPHSHHGKPWRSRNASTEIFVALRQEISPALNEKWAQRHAVVRSATSKAYQKVMYNFLALSPLSPEVRIDIITAMSAVLGWDPATTSKYWHATTAAMKSVNVEVTPLDRLCTKNLEILAKAKIPDLPTVPLSETDLQQILPAMSWEAQMILLISFLLGQRICDVIKLTTDQIHQVTDTTTHTEFVTLTFYDGKTIARLQPYTLHLPKNSAAGHLIMKWKDSPAKSVNAMVCNEIRIALQTVNNGNYSLLSIRKGGLQRMALAGMRDEDILTFSRHTTISMLHRYLDWGRVALTSTRVAHSLGLLDL